MSVENNLIYFYFERPTQFEAPFFKFIHQRGNLKILTIFEAGKNNDFDYEQDQKLSWGFDLLEGYSYTLLTKWKIFLSVICVKHTLVFNGYSHPHFFLAALIAKLFGRRIYLRTDSIIYPDGANSSISKRWIKKMIYRTYDGFLVTGIGGERYVRDFLKLSTDKKVIYFPYSVNLDYFTNDGVTSKNFIDIPVQMEKFLKADLRIPILVIAKLNYREAPFDLIYAFERYRGLKNIYKVTIVGGGNCLTQLQALCKAAGLEDTVQFFGYVPYTSLPAIYSWHDIFYHGPRSEPFGVSVVEAAAAGLFVITNSKVGATEELQRWSTAAHIYQSGDVLELSNVLLDLRARKWDRRMIADQAVKGFSYEVLEGRLIKGLID